MRSIVVQGGTIRGVGPDVSAPPDAEVVVFEGAVVTPGLLDLATDLGLGGPLSAAPAGHRLDHRSARSRSSSEATTTRTGEPRGPSRTNVSLETKLGDRLVSGDPAVAVARRGGSPPS